MPSVKNCAHCGNVFEVKQYSHKFCHVNCRGAFYKKEDPEKFRALQKAYRQKNPEVRARRFKEWREKNLDKRAQYAKDRKELRNAQLRERYASDPEYRARSRASYDKRKWTFDENFTYSDLLDLRKQDCFYCGGPGGSADHLVPKSKGGQDRLDNLVPACIPCNFRKGVKSVQEFYALDQV